MERLADLFLASDHVVVLVGADTGRQRTIVVDAGGATMPVLGELRYSTPELVAVERKVLTAASDGFGAPVPVADPEAVEAAIAARPELSHEQVAMIWAVCRAGEAVQPIVGRAGSGKTHALRACVDAFVVSGVPVVGCSVSATAAARLEESTELERLTGRSCDTVARLLVELDAPEGGGFKPGTICIVDEASALGTRDLARLLGHLERSGGALKLVGDPDQLSSVDVGGAFRSIAASRGGDLVTLKANHRQQDEEERLAVSDYREGRIAEALARYDAAGKVVRSPTLPASLDAMAIDWYTDRQAGIDAPMIAGPNALRRKLNARARILLRADGTLAGPVLRVNAVEFCTGDEVVARENDRGLHASDSRSFVKNGSRGIVVEVDLEGRTLLVEFTKEGRIRLPAGYLDRGKIEHAYAQTNFLAQGSDQRRTKYHPTEASRFEEGYVGITRAVEQTRIYVVDGHREHLEEEFVHAPEELLETGLSEIVGTLAQRGAQAMTHEVDATLGQAHPDLAALDLNALQKERRRLQAIVAPAPPSVSAALARAVETRDQLLARRLALTARTESTSSNGSPRMTGKATSRRIATIDRSLSRSERLIAKLRQKQQERQEFLDAHRPEFDRLQAIDRAEVAREARVRSVTLAGSGRDTLAIAGDARQSLAWRQRTQAAAMAHDRGRPTVEDVSAASELVAE